MQFRHGRRLAIRANGEKKTQNSGWSTKDLGMSTFNCLIKNVLILQKIK